MAFAMVAPEPWRAITGSLARSLVRQLADNNNYWQAGPPKNVVGDNEDNKLAWRLRRLFLVYWLV